MTPHRFFLPNLAVGIIDNGELKCTNMRAASTDIISYQVFFMKVSWFFHKLLEGDKHMDKKAHLSPR
jgi:hypothetical protein